MTQRSPKNAAKIATAAEREGWYLFGWTADASLEIGARLTASLSTTPAASADSLHVGGQFPLLVVEAPVALPEPSLTFPTWLDFYEGTGRLLTCPVSSTGCRPSRADVPEAAITHAAADTRWQSPQLQSGVAWEAHLEASPEHGDVVLPTSSVEYLGQETDPGLDLGRVVFPTPAPQYCVTLVVKDLRTGHETRAESCAKPQKSELATTDTKLAWCDAPPNLALTEAWCRLRGPDALSVCASLQAGGAGGSASTPAPGEAVSVNDADASSSTSKGCQLGGANGSPAGAALLLGLVVVARRRRNPVAR